MSLVPSFVETQEGLWYKNPVVKIPRVLYVCWDDDEPIELVFHHSRKLEDVIQLLGYNGWEVKPWGEVRRSYRCLTNRTMPLCKSVWLAQLTGPPKALIPGGEALQSRPQAEGVYFENKRLGPPEVLKKWD